MSPKSFPKAFLLAAKPIDKSGNLPDLNTLAHGFCYYYAFIFSQVIGGDLYTHMTPDKAGHAFVKFKGKFYDGDSWEGKKDWRDLQPYLKRANEKYVFKSNPKEFLKTWWVKKDKHKVFQDVIGLIKNNKNDFK